MSTILICWQRVNFTSFKSHYDINDRTLLRRFISQEPSDLTLRLYISRTIGPNLQRFISQEPMAHFVAFSILYK